MSDVHKAGSDMPRHSDLQSAVDAIAGIMEGTLDLVAVVDRDLRYQTFNTAYRDSFYRHFGVSIKRGDNLSEALSHMPDIRKEVVGCWKRALAGEEHAVDQYKEDPEGAQWYETRYVPIRDRNGVVVGASHISRTMSDSIRVQMELRESEQKFRMLFENAAEAILVFDSQGRVFDANRKACEQLGYTRDELTHMTPWDIDSLEEAREVQERIEQIDRDGEMTFETMHRRKDGTHLPVEVRARIVHYDGQQAVFAMARDLTERKRAAKASREREELYRGLFLNEHTAMLLVDPEAGEVVEANPAAASFYGYRRESLRGMKIHRINMQPEEEIRKNMEQAASFAENRFEFTHRLASGALRKVEVFSGPVHIRGRHLLFSIIHDITDRKLAERALRMSQERFRAFFRISPVPVALLSWKDSRILDANDAMLQFLDCGLDDLAGRTTIELNIWEDEEERLAVRKMLMESGRARDFEGRMRTRTGELRTVLISGDFIELDDEECVILVAKDISERKQMEQSLLRKNAVLEGVSRIFWDSLTCRTEEGLGMACLPVAEQITGSSFGFLGESGPDGLMHDIAISDPGWDVCKLRVEGRAERRTPPGGFHVRGLYGRVLASGQSLIVNDPASHPDSIGIPPGHPPLESFLGVPLKHGQKTFGMIGLGNKPGGYTTEDAEAVEALSVAIAEALLRTRAEKALRESRQDLKRAQAVAHVGNWRMDVRANTLEWSEESCRIFGIWPEATIGYETFLQCVHPSDREFVDACWQKALQGRPYDVEHRIVRNGEVRWVRELASLDYDERGEIVGAFGTTQDITERKQIEEALRRSEERFRMVLENSRDGIHLFDLKAGRFTFLSPAQERLTGFSQHELLDMTVEEWVERVHPEDRHWMETYVKQVIRGDDPGVPVEYRWKVKSGEHRWFSDSRKAILDDKGRAVAVVGVSRDVTWRKELEDQLILAAREASDARRESERRTTELRAALQSAPIGAVFYDTGHRISYVNKSAEEILGFTLEDFQALSGEERIRLFRVCRTDRTVPPKEELAGYRALHGEVVTDEEFLVYPQGGDEPVHVLSQAAPIIMDGEIIGAVQTIQDITERKRIEEALSQAKEEADKANRAKSEFLANMSHEIRTPLTGLLGMTDLLLDNLKIEKNIEYARYMKRAGEALRIIIDDILDLSKIEAGRMEHRPAPVLIRESIRQSVALFEPMAREKGLDWEVTLAPNLPESLSIDEAKLHQVLRNLVSNAVKFTDRGGIGVTVEYAEAEEAGDLRIAIQDTGVGIPEDRRHELFQEFTQLDSSYQKIHGGTGLGLAISRQLVELMGGSIGFESEPERGSTFSVTIPAPETPYPAAIRPESRRASGCEHLRILAAEDNPINQFLIREMLADAKCQYSLVENGEKVLEALDSAEEPYDLVLMDINMPKLDGIQTTKRIRESGRPYAGIPVIALTAYAMPEERERFMAAGLDGYLAKPFTIGQFIGALSELPSDSFPPPQASARAGEPAGAAAPDPAPAGPHRRGVLDKGYLEAHFGKQRSNLRALVDILEADTPGQLEHLGECMREDRLGDAADQVHYLASGFRTVGMLRAADECLRLEKLLRGGEADKAKAAFDELQGDIEQSIDAVKAWAGAIDTEEHSIHTT